ncbi:MAG: hypothetical protein IT405_02925 [Candidatus Yanofskybacteria bacterium]|nr:hypothetical protein [Candidatus Yanofskybacteria bacterium]
MRRFFLACAVVVFAGLAAPAHADTLGQSNVFRVNAFYDASGATTVAATLRAVGQKGYFYVDDRSWSALTPEDQQRFSVELNALSSAFDGVIYPRLTTLWGFENTPGVDGDPHVVILLQRLITGSGGYFETINNYTKDRAPDSNAREMIFVNAESVLSGYAKSFTAHEFQHLISFNQKELLQGVEEDVWLNEGRSEYSITAAGYSEPFIGSTLERRAQAFIRSPSDSLVEWPNTSADYAVTSLFLHYVADRYGSDGLASTLRTSVAGIPSFDAWLSARGAPERFGDVFTDWMVASILNDRSRDPRYGYATAGLQGVHVTPTMRARVDNATPRTDFSVFLQEWQPAWVTADVGTLGTTGEPVSVRVAGQGSWRGAVIAVYGDGTSTVMPFVGVSGSGDIHIPRTSVGGAGLFTITAALTQGVSQAVGTRTLLSQSATVSVALGSIDAYTATAPVAATPSLEPRYVQPVDGDLIRRTGQSDMYVVWGKYRRYITKEVLALYGFQDRPIRDVPDEVFFRYSASFYIREEGGKKVYAIRPEGTKHWLNITPTQWDASGRDWGAIFTVNEREVAYYATGRDIVQ